MSMNGKITIYRGWGADSRFFSFDKDFIIYFSFVVVNKRRVGR